jgi:arabinogalactan endo-1,4-beta-galactosidase
MKYILLICSLYSSPFFVGCQKSSPTIQEVTVSTPTTEIRGVDISELPEIATYNVGFKNRNGIVEDALTTLKNAGVNTIRLKLWHTPTTSYNGFSAVKNFATTLKQKGFKIWLTVHYSDTWADPGSQQTPQAWQGIGFATLKDSVANYTTRIMHQINPDFIQIGNEINNGLLHPTGSLANELQCIGLLQTASNAIRQVNNNTKIIIHYAGTQGASSFYTKMTTVPYDYIGLSFYPIWHYQTIAELTNNINSLSNTFGKKVLIAETAYPFTLQWNDYTNNIIGLQGQLLTPYTATSTGQKDFITAIKNIQSTAPNYLGFCYWGAALVAYKGPTATDGSPWENQALWDFNLQALPVMEAFK